MSEKYSYPLRYHLPSIKGLAELDQLCGTLYSLISSETFVPQVGGNKEFIKEEQVLQSPPPCRTEFQVQGTLMSWLVYQRVKCSKKFTHKS